MNHHMAAKPSPSPSPAIPKPAAQAMTLDKLPALAERIKSSIANLRLALQAPERQLVSRAVTLKAIVTPEDAEDAGRDLVMIKRIRRAGETHYDLLKRPFNQVRSLVLGWEGEDVGELITAEKNLDRLIVSWRREQIRRDEAARAEQQRLADLAAREEHDRQVAALQRVADVELNPIVAEALVHEAQSLAQAPVAAPLVYVESSVPVIPRLSFTKTYRAEIVGDPDLLRFVKAIAAKKIPLRASVGIVLAKDDAGKDRIGIYTSPWLNDQARANDGELTFPGVTVRDIEGTAGR